MPWEVVSTTADASKAPSAQISLSKTAEVGEIDHRAVFQSEEQIVSSRKALEYPPGLCSACQTITLERLLAAMPLSRGPDGRRFLPGEVLKLSLKEHGSENLGEGSTCPLSGLITDPHPHESFAAARGSWYANIYLFRDTMEGVSKFRYIDDCWFDEGGKLAISAEKGTYASQYLTRCVAEDSASEITLNTIKEWFRNCDVDHPECCSGSTDAVGFEDWKPPTRLIQIGQTDQDLKLVETKGRPVQYNALSHCWGNRLQIATTACNLAEHLEAIAFPSLPKTFQDAISITRKLGIEFLWIDSLCIVQDDEIEWSMESERMGSIYQHAYCTIAATAASSSSEGCFTVRQPTNAIRLPCCPNEPQKGYMYLGPAFEERFTEIMDAPLNKRAWVLQERILSRRTIHFAKRQTYRECAHQFVAEDRTDLRFDDDAQRKLGTFLFLDLPSKFKKTVLPPVRPSGSTSRPQPQSQFHADSFLKALYDLWTTLVEYYSQCGLTCASDKLPALSGLARVIKERRHLTYYAGHWMDDTKCFIHSLLWCAGGTQGLDRPTKSRCSSWAWAALDGPLRFIINPRNSKGIVPEEYHLYINPLGIESLSYGNLHQRLELRCSGILQPSSRLRFRLNLYRNDSNWPSVRRFYYINEPQPSTVEALNFGLGNSRSGFHGWVLLDCDDAEPESFVLIPLCTYTTPRGRRILTLVAQQEGSDNTGKEPEYRRIGVAELKYWGLFEASRKESFRLS